MIKYLVTETARVAALLFLACSAASAQTAPGATAAAAGQQPTIKLTAVVMALPAGTPWFHIRQFPCSSLVGAMSEVSRSATGGRDAQDLPPYTAVFNAELAKAGLKAVADDDLFNREDTAAADYQVGAVVTAAKSDACVSNGSLLSPGKRGEVSGTGSMNVDWQVYSPVRKEVVARISTSGSINIEHPLPDGLAQLLTGSFADNVRALAASAEFRTAMSAKPVAPQDVLSTDQQSKIVLSGNQKAAKRPIADTVGSVVTIMTGSGSGSGVLLSDDGYVLTDAHVVGDEKELRVRWSDGIEKVGEVIRVSKTRDVALVKTDPRGRPPVPIQLGRVSPAQRVYAIGSPAGKQFQGTVSSGVVSASRTINGLNYIQSDVSVSPGSSGGALLDESGALLGLTDLGFQNEGQPAGLNLFTPIGDAMDFLNLEQD
jgi:serine protease Do